jgi:hypothetical protein
MATLKTKFVDVGITAGGGGAFYGYSVGNAIGTVSDTANGSSDQTLDAGTVFSESTRVTGLYYQAFTVNNVYFEVQGERANSNSSWQTHTAGSNTYNRNDATYFYNSSTNRSRWNWPLTSSESANSAANPYGTSSGADIEVSWDDQIPLGLTEALFTVSGSNSAWTTQNVDISAFADHTVRLVFHHELPATAVGFTYLADLQLDDIRLDGTTYSFENTGHGWQTTTSNVQPNETSYCAATFATLAVGTTAGRWNVDTAGTGSGGTGLPTADVGSYYVYTETSAPVADSDGFFLRSQSTVLGSSPTLQFAEARSGSNIGTLTVYLDVIARPAAAATAPTISDVTNDNATSSSVTVTVSLSNNGQGGTGLFYGRASTSNSDNVSSWQSSNTFTQSRSSNFYYFASRSSDTGASNTLASSGVLEAVPFLAPVVPQINQVTNNAYLQSGDTTFQHSSQTNNSDTNGSRVQIRTGSYTGTVVGTTSGSSGTEYFTVNDAPAQNSSKTYYITYFRLESTGGSGSAGLTNYGTFTAYRAGDAAGTVTLDSKWIDVGTTSGGGGLFRGYGVGYGDVSNTADGATNSSIENTYATAPDLYVADHQDFTGDQTRLAFSQSVGLILDTTKVTKVTIDGKDFALANASSFNSGSPQRGYITWTTNLGSNPFGTTTGANKLVEFKLETATGANASITNTSLSASQAVNSVATISNASSTQRYRIIKESGSTAGGVANGAVVGGRTGGGTLTIDNSEQPGVGETCTYQIQTSGAHADFFTDSLYTDVTGTNNSFTITRASVVASAPVISDVTNNNAAASSVTVTVSLSNNGQGGDGLFYGRASTNNSDNVSSWQSGNTFSQSRSSNFYYFASRSSDTGASNTLASSGVLEAVPFLTPDTSVSASNVTISSSATNASVVIGNVTSGERYQIRNSTGSTSYQSACATSTSVTITQTSGLPSATNSSSSYQIYARRPVGLGGDNLYDATGDTFTITRSADRNPETYTVLAGDVTDAIPNILYYATFSSEAASNSSAVSLNLGTTIDDGTSISSTNGEWGTDGLNWQSSSGTVDANDTVFYRGTSPGGGGNQTYSLRIGTVSRSFDITSGGDNLPESYSALAGSLNGQSTAKLVYATFSSASAGFVSPGTAFNVGTEVDNATSVSATNGEWSTNGTSWTASSGTVDQNDNIYFRARTSSSEGVIKAHSLKIGGTGQSFTTFTSGFNFWQLPGKREQALNTLVTSAIDTINGIPNNTPISVTGTGSPQIRVNSGTWTTSTTINDGDTIQARLTTANANAEMRYADIKLSGAAVPSSVSREVWNVTTLKPAGSTEYKYRLRRSSDKFGVTSTVLQKDSSGSVPTLVTLSKGDVISISSGFGQIVFGDTSGDDRFRMFGGHYGDLVPLISASSEYKLDAGIHKFTYLRNWGASRSSFFSMGSFVALGEGYGSAPYKNTVANTLPDTSNRSVSINSQSAYATGSFTVSGLTAGIYAGFSSNIVSGSADLIVQWSRSASFSSYTTSLEGLQNGDTVYYRALSPPYDNVTQTYRAFAFDSFGRNIANANEANSDFDIDVIVNPSNSAVYGMEFFDSSGSSILSVNDRSNRFAVKGSYTVTSLGAGSSDNTTINLTGMDTSDNWVINARVDLAGQTAAEYIGVNSISQSSGRFTVTTFNSDSVARTFDVDYLAILTG